MKKSLLAVCLYLLGWVTAGAVGQYVQKPNSILDAQVGASASPATIYGVTPVLGTIPVLNLPAGQKFVQVISADDTSIPSATNHRNTYLTTKRTKGEEPRQFTLFEYNVSGRFDAILYIKEN